VEKTASNTPVPEKWKSRFFILWAGQAASLFGASLVSFALIWWLTVETGSTSIMAASTFFTILPGIVLGPFSGTIIDRVSRKKIMLYADVAVAFLTIILVTMFYFNAVEPWRIITLMFMREVGVTFRSPAMTATTTLMVPGSQLTRIQGINQTLNGIIRIIAPPTGALLISIAPIYAVLSIDILTTILAIIPLLIIMIPSPPKKESINEEKENKASFWSDTKEGFKFVLIWRALFWVVATCTMANIFLGPVRSFQPLMVTQIFQGGALEISYISMVAGGGVIAGGILMSIWTGFKRKLITSATGWIGIGIAYVIASLAPGNMYYLFLSMMFIVGFMTPVGCAPLEAFYQSSIPADKQGRVFSVLGSLDGITIPIGLLIAWLFGDIVPLRLWYLMVGVSHAVLGFIWLGIPFIRRAEVEAEERQQLDL